MEVETAFGNCYKQRVNQLNTTWECLGVTSWTPLHFYF